MYHNFLKKRTKESGKVIFLRKKEKKILTKIGNDNSKKRLDLDTYSPPFEYFDLVVI